MTTGLCLVTLAQEEAPRRHVSLCREMFMRILFVRCQSIPVDMMQDHPSKTVSLTASCMRFLDELVVAGPCYLKHHKWILVLDPIYATMTSGSGAGTMSHTQETLLVLWGGWGRQASFLDVRERARVLERHV